MHAYITPKLRNLRKDYLKFKDSLGSILSPISEATQKSWAWKTNCQLSPTKMLHFRYLMNQYTQTLNLQTRDLPQHSTRGVG